MAKKKKRLNVTFLVVLTSVVAVLLVLGVVAGWLYKESPGRAVRRAQEAEERGDWEKAAEQWDKAARYSNNSADYKLKAVDATLHLTAREDGPDRLRAVYGIYTSVLGTDPSNLEALRGMLRLAVESGRLDVASADPDTREARRIAGEILKQKADDAEALTLRAVATLNLSGFTGEGVTPEQVAQAKRDLEQVAANQPRDGLALIALTRRRLQDANQASQGGDPAAALQQWQDVVAFVDAAAKSAGELPAGADADRIGLERRIGEAYRAAAGVKPLFDAAQLIKNGQQLTPEQARALNEDPLVKELTAKADARIGAAAGALDDARDALSDVFRVTLLTRADVLQQAGKLDEAQAAYERLWAARPWDSTAASALAQFHRQRGQVEEALAVLKTQRRRNEEGELPALTGYAGLLARQNQLLIQPLLADAMLARREQVPDAAEREALLKEAKSVFDGYDAARRARGYGESATTARIRGQIQIASGDTVQGLQTINSALRMTESAVAPADKLERLRALSLAAAANEQLGQTGGVRRALEEMIKIQPNLPQLRAQLAQNYVNQGDMGLARPLIDGLLRDDPTNQSYQQLAARAVPASEQAAAYDKRPEETPEQRRLKFGEALRLGRDDDAVRLGRAVLADAPNDTNVALLLGQHYAKLGRKDEAIALLEPLAGESPQAKLLLAQARGGSDELIEAMPDGVDKLLIKARLAASRGDEAESVADLRAARQLAPDNVAVARQLFDVYARQENVDAAAQLAAELKAKNADGMDGRGYDVRLDLMRGENDRAVRTASSLVTDFPQIAEAYGLQGAALLRSGQPGEAAESYRRALDISPVNPSLLSGAITALQAAGRGEEIKPYLETGLRVDPNNVGYRNAQMGYELQYGDAKAVIARLRDAAAAAPEDASKQFTLGQALLAAGNVRTAAAAGAPNPATATSEAAAYFRQAMAAFKDGLTRFPTEAQFLQGLVAAATRIGEAGLAEAAPAVDAALASESASSLAGDPRAAGAAADLYVARNETSKAEDVLRRAVAAAAGATGTAADPAARERKAGLLLMLSDVVARQGRIDDAVDVLRGFEDVPAVQERAFNLLATRSATNPNDAAAYEAMRAATDASVNSGQITPGGLNVIAFAELQRGDLARAEMLLKRSTAKRPNDPRTMLFEAAVEARKPGGDLDRAVDLLKRALNNDAPDADILAELARVYSRQGQRDEAAQTLARLSEVRPTDVAVRLELLNLLLSVNPPRTAEALRVFREADAAGVGGDPQLLMKRSQLELGRNRPDEALDFARRAADAAKGTPVEPAVLDAYLALLLQEDKPDLVLQRTQAAASPTSADPAASRWTLLRARGEALARLNRTPEAVEAYGRAYKAAAAEGAGGRLLGDMSRRLGFDAAYALLKDRVEPADGSAASTDDLATAAALFASSDEKARAIELLQRAEAQAKGDGTPAGKLAVIQSQLGTLYLASDPPQLAEAERTMRAALANAPADAGLLNNLSYAITLQAQDATGAEATAKRDEALKFAKQAYDAAGAAAGVDGAVNPSVTDTYAGAIAAKARAEGDAASLAQAVALLREARVVAERVGQPFPELYLHLSQALAAQKDGPAAREAARAGVAFLDRQRAAKATVDASVERDLRAALEEAETLGGTDAATGG